ncbi:hypothetical protein [Duganella violaceipulchra]|uniref:Uncharacterized protein n=1 Tax=Duganella violaceipulchra TaxID=2849652 RepID=A0ABT1GKM9_9BURK|nr:hypothetical protein [Duganella violaceicalia]MCP2009526.1 hypothetical protein [Duganella violaceicalia]
MPTCLDPTCLSRDWTRAIAESERLAEAFARWCERPDLAQAAAF